MNINIPDKIFKLTTLLGMIITGYCLYSIQAAYELYQIKIIETTNPAYKEIFENIYLDLTQRMTVFAFIGFIILIFSLIAWYNWEKNEEIKQYEKIYKCCQSCGKNFSSIRSYGTNEDNSINLSFCKECFQNGSFTNPNLSIDQLLIDAEASGYKTTKYPIFVISLRKRLESLDRWHYIEY